MFVIDKKHAIDYVAQGFMYLFVCIFLLKKSTQLLRASK
ncbi:hypothetical protein CV83915_04189 [Escherichia coli]|uniref:Uncharacterized protein n=1 Tax=Escherichia coli TaxID=562 RepID=A0A2H4TY59_ECOLX|nr:hypothetical protein CV83915_04129 [Escherichia coli]ATZ34465.1 hypothetical protein CV83915_04189 [Escherichia coli]